jgi:hypothetical protein
VTVFWKRSILRSRVLEFLTLENLKDRASFWNHPFTILEDILTIEHVMPYVSYFGQSYLSVVSHLFRADDLGEDIYGYCDNWQLSHVL